MSQKQSLLKSKEPVHHYYMSIINAIPHSLYWVDTECNMLGCNARFVAMLGLNSLRDFKGTPYQQMKKYAHWDDEWLKIFQLNDMQTIFSGTAHCDREELPVFDKKGVPVYFKSTRIPMLDENKKITGLIVVLTDISAYRQNEAKKVPSVKVNTPAPTTTRLPNVLMVEDNFVTQHIEKALLTALNCQVDIAESGDKAIELFDPGKYDLVLMDIGLQETSGYVVAKQLRNKEKNTQHHVPIIALTGYEADAVKEDCKQYFMEGAITKPLTSEQAEQIIKHYVFHEDTKVNGLKTGNMDEY